MAQRTSTRLRAISLKLPPPSRVRLIEAMVDWLNNRALAMSRR
jgi:hypothetical protein